MALLENNVRRRLSYSYLMERNLKLVCSTKITVSEMYMILA
jgi:hypothetical protein